MGTLRIDRTEATLGAVVTGVRLATLGDADSAAIQAAFSEHAVLVFPGQHLDDEQQVRFAQRFGELSIDLLRFSNRGEDGSLLGPDDPLVRLLKGNEGWHTDSSFKQISAKASMLSAREVPPSGGETEWADMRAAFDALDAETRARIADLCAYHSLYHSQSRLGEETGSTAAALATLAGAPRSADNAGAPGSAGKASSVSAADDPPLRPLVKHHPATGRPALFIGRHAYGVPGLSDAESEALLDQLLQHACQSPRVLTHRWQPGDLVAWDNRCVLHRARPFDPNQGRVMIHSRVAGDPVTEAGVAPLAGAVA